MLLLNGYRRLFLKVKPPERDVGYLHLELRLRMR
jgi:hypothetical protein